MDIALTLAVVFLWAVLIGYLKYDPVSPTSVFILSNIAVLAGGYYLRPDSDLFALIGRTGEFFYYSAYCSSLVLTLAFGFGALLVRVIPLGHTEPTSPNHQSYIPPAALAAAPKVAAIAIVIFIIGTGPVSLFIRHEYLTENIRALKQVGGTATLILCFFLGSSSSQKKDAIQSIGLLIVAEIAFFGYASRSSAFGLLLFFFGRYYFSRTKKNLALLLFAVAAIPAVVHVSLYMRAQPTQGLIPLFDELIYGHSLYSTFSYEITLTNFVFSTFYITALTRQIAEIDTTHIIASLNPLPGGLAGWYDEANGIHPFIPYTAFGEWITYSTFAGGCFYLGIGLLFGWIDKQERTSGILYRYIAPGFLIAYTELSSQYTVRASTRYLYYLLLFIFLRRLTRFYMKIKGARLSSSVVIR